MLRRGDLLGVDSFDGVLAFDGVLPGVLVSIAGLGWSGGGDDSLARLATGAAGPDVSRAGGPFGGAVGVVSGVPTGLGLVAIWLPD